jgi:hypothetical protein
VAAPHPSNPLRGSEARAVIAGRETAGSRCDYSPNAHTPGTSGENRAELVDKVKNTL